MDAAQIGPPSSQAAGFQPEAEDSSPSANLGREEQQAVIQQALAKLDPIDRQIIQLRFFENQRFDQIGKQVQLDESTVRSRLQRILERLGQELKGLQ